MEPAVCGVLPRLEWRGRGSICVSMEAAKFMLIELGGSQFSETKKN